MLNLIAVILGLALVLPVIFMLAYKAVYFLLSYFFGENITVTYIDENGVKRSTRINCKRDDELLAAIDKLKNQTRQRRHA